MSLLTRLRRFARAKKGVATEVGGAVVVHVGDGGTVEARALAASLAIDPEHQVLVADLPRESTIEAWEALAAVLPQDRRPLRVVPGRYPLQIDAKVGPWLAERIGRPVLAPYGLVHHGAAGALFVHSGPRTGWGWFQAERDPEWAAKRFPRPAWEVPAFVEDAAAGAGAVAEPLPAGMWIRPDEPVERFARERVRLIRTLPCQRGMPVIVLGSHDVPGVSLDNVTAFWRTLPSEVRDKVWFAVFGGIAAPAGRPIGQALADAVGAEVRCYTGLPVGSPEVPDVCTVRPDGAQGWNAFAKGLAYRPRDVQPRLCAHRAPIEGLPEIAPGVYRFTPDAVLEIVQAGLWVRTPEEGIGEPAARAVAPDPSCTLVLYDATAGRMRGIAESVAARVDRSTRPVTRALPAVVPQPKAEATAELKVDAVVEPKADATTELKVEATAELEADAVPGRSVDESADTALPHLSRMMETMTMPVLASARPSERPLSRLAARLEGITDERHR